MNEELTMMETEETYEENNNYNTVENCGSSSGGGVSLSTALVGAALIGIGVLGGKVVRAIKNKKQKGNEEPNKKTKKKLMWVEVPADESEEEFDEFFEEIVEEPEVVEKEENK